MTNNGYAQLADRFSQEYDAWAPQISPITRLDTRTAYEIWGQENNLSGTAANPNSSPHQDGISNLLKFAFNLDPTKADTRHIDALGNSGLPLPTATQTINGPTLQIVSVQRRNTPGLVYTAEFSDTIDDWTASEITSTPVQSTMLDTTWDRVVFQDPEIYPGGNRFGRIRITYTPP